MKLCVIGLGKIGSALVQGMLQAGIYQAEEIIGCDINVTVKESNEAYGGIQTTTDNCQGAEQSEVVLLAVKPQVINKVLVEIKDVVKDKLVVSVAAGISIDHLESFLPSSCRVVRVMPNTPILVKEGISAIASNKTATKEDVEMVKEMFSGVGEVVEVEEELMDAVTGLSGSGPAYVYMIIEALADGGVLTGISRELALKLAAQTVLGSAKMVLETGKHPGELKDMVTSPGGTSIRGVEVLESHGLRGVIIDAVKKATERSKELNNI